jgi:hypothetical protein
LISINDIYK